MKLTKIFNKKFPEEKDNKLIEQINKETLGRKTVSNVLKRKSTKNNIKICCEKWKKNQIFHLILIIKY